MQPLTWNYKIMNHRMNVYVPVYSVSWQFAIFTSLLWILWEGCQDGIRPVRNLLEKDSVEGKCETRRRLDTLPPDHDEL